MLKGKRSKLSFSCIGGIGCLWIVFAALYPPLPSPTNPLFFYSGHLRDDLRRVMIHAIEKAERSITLQMYGLTDPLVIAHLLKKQAEGVAVRIFYDKKGTPCLPLSLQAFCVDTTALMHRKILIIDETLVMVGTANCTPSSLKMHGNVVVGLWNPFLATFFTHCIDGQTKSRCGMTTIEAYLFPEKGKEGLGALIEQIDTARQSIFIAMFTLTHPKIIAALIRAHQRGVHVLLCLDRYTAEGASTKALCLLQEEGITCRINQGSELLHHKWALIDRDRFVIGSANWTKAAFESNQDLLLIFTALSKKEQKLLHRLCNRLVFSTQSM